MTDFKTHNFQKPIIWHKAMESAELFFEFTKTFSVAKMYEMTDQMNKYAVLMSSNFAEASSSTNKPFSHFLDITLGLLFEIQTQLLCENIQDFVTEKQTIAIESK
jgi:four helix bundle protein